MSPSKAAQAALRCPLPRAQLRGRFAELPPRAGGASLLHYVLLVMLPLQPLQPVPGPSLFFVCMFFNHFL